MKVIDCHIHCGIQNVQLPFSRIEPLLEDAEIEAACLYPPVEDIYYRYSDRFKDDEPWAECRARAHEYLLDLAKNKKVYPYYFVWNDFSVENLDLGFYGIKWHHHAGEPPYQYDDPKCDEMIDAICERRLPVVLEETFRNTMEFIHRIDGRTIIIIPHLGLLNGGFEQMMDNDVWDAENIWADTALADMRDMLAYRERYGSDRLIFGSDYPFGYPGKQLENLRLMDIPTRDLEKICCENIQRLLGLDDG